MNSQLRLHFATAALLVLASSISAQIVDAPRAAAADEKGDLWEVTSQMSMEGMPMGMPAQTSRVCAPKDWKEPPAGRDERHECKNSDFKAEGPKVTWKVACTGAMPMTGEGEITRDGTDAYAGTIKFTSSEAKMITKLNGRRVGECDTPQQ
jgi:hypothetical protein